MKNPFQLSLDQIIIARLVYFCSSSNLGNGTKRLPR